MLPKSKPDEAIEITPADEVFDYYLPEQTILQPDGQISAFSYVPPKSEPADVLLSDLPPDDELPSPEPVKAFIDDIGRRGVQDRIKLIERPDGKYDVADGRRRVKAARRNRMQTIPAEIFPEGTRFAEVITGKSNHLRSHNPQTDILSILKLRKAKYTEKQIAQLLGMNPGLFKKRCTLLNLIEPLMDQFLAGELPVGVAESTAKLTASEQRELSKLERVTHTAIKEVRSATIRQVDTSPLFEKPLPNIGKSLPDRIAEMLRNEGIAEATIEKVKSLLID